MYVGLNQQMALWLLEYHCYKTFNQIGQNISANWLNTQRKIPPIVYRRDFFY